jgi:hypothetical protein
MRLLLGFLFCSALAVSQPPADGRALAATYATEVDRRLDIPLGDQAAYAALIPQLEGGSQFVALVDRSPFVQAFLLFWLDPSLFPHFIGASPVSTGRPGRFDYFETPLGVFAHTLDNPDYRALGTKNSLGIRGYGVKGMRVYDFGWVHQKKGWGNQAEIEMRLQMHATDPLLLEPFLGIPRSKGCIRIPATLNTLLDRFGILDADYQRAASEGRRHFTLRPDWQPTPWAGRYIVIVDTGRSERPVWSPRPR